MKHISKQNEPQSFLKWKDQNQTCSWGDFAKTEEYQELKAALCSEQDGLCCYCEIAIQGTSDAHIEHHKPKSSYPKEIYNFENLLTSCQNTDSCGHKKNNNYFPEIVSPLDSDCENKFTYTGNGKIIPANENDNHAQETIKQLGLDCKRLKDRRNSILKIFEDCDDQYILKSLANYKEWYSGFYTVVQYIAHKRGVQ